MPAHAQRSTEGFVHTCPQTGELDGREGAPQPAAAARQLCSYSTVFAMVQAVTCAGRPDMAYLHQEKE